ncbi:hypothetical protein LSTR_LSTR011520 [Laodelphax striatellus]|uniref:Uncharacterized protein n=1 Tax=Laodelphax striatellus TaxID=195883 RepID=A0A482WEE3_LAOST|nr:hypothetical protein LSTR_LSTR011520 [Laodelphax striatellus]
MSDLSIRRTAPVGQRVQDLVLDGVRGRGRPKMRWKDKIAADMQENGWRREEALDRVLWRSRLQTKRSDPI